VAIEVKILREIDANALAHVAPGLFDDPIILVRAREFLTDKRSDLRELLQDAWQLLGR
jgi:hypothetical protein